jgi:hypothetical protein
MGNIGAIRYFTPLGMVEAAITAFRATDERWHSLDEQFAAALRTAFAWRRTPFSSEDI